MTYYCGISMGELGVMQRDPHILCDGCSAYAPAYKSNGLAKAWAINGKPPKGWKVVTLNFTDANETHNPKKLHYCPACKWSL